MGLDGADGEGLLSKSSPRELCLHHTVHREVKGQLQKGNFCWTSHLVWDILIRQSEQSRIAPVL